MWAHKHWRHKDSFMCFSWTPKMTDVVTRLGCGWDGCSGTCTAFALPQSELLVKGQELKNVIFRGSVKYVIPRFHRWGGVGGYCISDTYADWKVMGHLFCMILRLLSILEVLGWMKMWWRGLSLRRMGAVKGGAADILHHSWMKRIPAKVGFHWKRPDSPMSKRQLLNCNFEP